MGSVGAAFTEEWGPGWALAVSPPSDQRDPVPAAYWPAMAGPATPLRKVADALRPPPQMVSRRHLGRDLAGHPVKRRWPDRLEHGQRGLLLLPDASALGRRSATSSWCGGRASV